MLLTILACVAVFLLIFIAYTSDDGLLAGFSAFILGLIAVVMIAFCITAPGDNETRLANYYALKEVIEYQRTQDLSQFERVQLIDQIHETNKMINSHRTWYKSIWIGQWHSEEIANLEYLK